jgi:hypothetical protein
MNDNNTPSAFPTPGRVELRDVPAPSKGGTWHEHKIPSKDGMTLRDYFAAQAIAGAASDVVEPIEQETIDVIARNAYAVAEAMLRARGI